MRKWNEEAAPNNNRASADIQFATGNKKEQVEFSEELSDSGERNERFKEQKTGD